jgi:salicylate hydroxylase
VKVGAGIQIPPNSARILQRFGVLDEIKKLSVLPHAFVMRSYKGPELNRQPMLPYCEETYGAPYLHIHRADFHSVLIKRAEALGINSMLSIAIPIRFPY